MTAIYNFAFPDKHRTATVLVVLLVASAMASVPAGEQAPDNTADSISGTEEATIVDATDGDTGYLADENGRDVTWRSH